MSATSSMRASGSEALHELVERIGQSRSNLRSEMGVDLRAAGTAMSEILLNDAQIDACFQQMSGVRMPQRVYVRIFADPGRLTGAVKRLSQSGLIDQTIPAARRGE